MKVDKRDLMMFKQISETQFLGEKIGYGNLIEIARALWRSKLQSTNMPVNKELIKNSQKGLNEIYDSWIEAYNQYEKEK